MLGEQVSQVSDDVGHISCAGRLGSADGPHRFVRNNHAARRLPVVPHGGRDLLEHERRRHRRIGDGLLADTQQRSQPCFHRGPDLQCDHGVVLGEMPASFSVSDLHEPHTQLRQQPR